MKLTEVTDEYIRKQDAVDAATRDSTENRTHSFRAGQARSASRIKALPAADVAPVVHGRWEHHMSFGICGKCGYEYNWTGADAKNYCPNCGAKMD